MLKEMGNQNATGIQEEDKAANQTPGNPSNENAAEENKAKDDQPIPADEIQELSESTSGKSDHDPPGGAGERHVDNQPLDNEEKDAHVGEREVNSTEPSSNEDQGNDDQASAVRDEVEDQENGDTAMNSTEAVSHESDVLHLDAKSDDHVLEKISQDPSSLVGKESTETSCSADEIAFPGAEGEIGGLMVENLSESEEEKVIDKVDISEEESKISNTNLDMGFVEVNDRDSSSKDSYQPEVLPSANDSTKDETEDIEAGIEESRHEGINEDASEMNFIDQELGEGDETEVAKDVMIMNRSLDVKTCDHVTDIPASPQKLKEADEGSEDDETKNSTECAGNSGEENDPGSLVEKEIAHFKDLEIVDAKVAPDHCNLTYEKHNQFHPPSSKTNPIQITQSTIEKSPSFNFDSMDCTKKEETEQTPLLYYKRAPMRSLSTPVDGGFIIHDGSAEEKTINIVLERRGSKKPTSPLHGHLKEDEETQLLKPHRSHEEDEILETQKELCNGYGLEIVPSSAQGREKRNKARVSGSYFFSSCICCAGVGQLNADP